MRLLTSSLLTCADDMFRWLSVNMYNTNAPSSHFKLPIVVLDGVMSFFPHRSNDSCWQMSPWMSKLSFRIGNEKNGDKDSIVSVHGDSEKLDAAPEGILSGAMLKTY